MLKNIAYELKNKTRLVNLKNYENEYLKNI